MHRTLYIVGIGYLAICAAVLARRRSAAPPFTSGSEPAGATVASGSPAQQWFAGIKPYCNAVEVEVAQRQHPAPASLEGRGFSAACFALAGRIESARAVLNQLPRTDRSRGAGIVFDVAHPVADAGDDRSAGPIMELVVEYWPNHYMALYHAGMAEYGLGEWARARTHLQAFLGLYSSDDGWRRNAQAVLGRLR